MTNIELTASAKYPLHVTFRDPLSGAAADPITTPPPYTIYGPDSKDTIKETGTLALATAPITGSWGKIIDVSGYALGVYVVVVTGDPGGIPVIGSTTFAVTTERSTAAALVTHDTEVKSEIDVNEGKIDAVQSSVDAIQNNTRHILSVPQRINRPASGSTTYRLHFRLYDTAGNPEDPDADTVNIAIEDLSGADIVAPGTMTKVTIGQYFFDFVVLSSFTLEPIAVLLDWLEAAIAFNTVRAAEIVDDDVVESEIQSKLDDIKAVTDDIPDYIRTEIDAPVSINRPSIVTQIDMDLGLGAAITDLIVDGTTNFPRTGHLRIEDEIVSFTKVDNISFTIVRALFGTTAVLHADDTIVYLLSRHTIEVRWFKNLLEEITGGDGDWTFETEDGALFVGGPSHAQSPISVVDIFIDRNEIRLSGIGATPIKNDTDRGDDYQIYLSATLTSPAQVGIDDPVGHMAIVITDLPSLGEVIQGVIAGGDGELRVDQDGYFQLDGTRVLWIDDLKGPVREAVTGKRVDDAIISFWRVDQLDRGIFDTPSAQTKTDPNGNWASFLDPGRYLFTIRSFDLDFGDGELRDLVG